MISTKIIAAAGMLAGASLFSVSQGAQAGGTQPISPKRVFDFNGDGQADIFVADIAYSVTEAVNGKVLVNSIDGTPLRTILSPHASDMFGLAVAPLGNIDGSPGDEIAVSAPLGHDSANGSGAVFVYSNSSDEPIMVLTNPTGEGVFGTGLLYRRSALSDGTPRHELVVMVDPVHDLSDYDATEDMPYTWVSFNLETGAVIDTGLLTDFPENADWGDTWTHRAGVRGDINVDGVLSQADIQALESLLGNTSPGPGIIIRGDLNRDGVVNEADMAILIADLAAGGGSSHHGFVVGIIWRDIIRQIRGTGLSVGFFALVRAGGCIAIIDAVAITCMLSTDTDEDYALCFCDVLMDPGSLGPFCQHAFLGYDLVNAISDYIGCPGMP